MTSEDPGAVAAVVLTGGGGRRLGGVDKATLDLGGQSLLERALATVAACDPVVVVGPEVPVPRPVRWTREEPPGGGPAAGLLAGLDALRHEPVGIVCVLAVDMPGVDASSVRRLVEALAGASDVDGACLTDATGRLQWLAAAYRVSALRAARPVDTAEHAGLPMHRLLAGLHLVGVPSAPGEADDVDTWEDWRRVTREVEG